MMHGDNSRTVWIIWILNGIGAVSILQAGAVIDRSFIEAQLWWWLGWGFISVSTYKAVAYRIRKPSEKPKRKHNPGDYRDELKDELRQAFEDVQSGNVHEISTLWDESDGE